ncbi:hypothetical protein M8J75_000099 [Diaphorina citri]|nr:hypothetical protein M8J75_000099 [Diaphorina citri]
MLGGDDDDSTGPVNLSAPLFPLSFSPSTPDDLPPLPPTGGQHSAPANSYLQELTASGFWSFNDSIDLTKYEQFDHSKFLGQYPSGGLDLTLPAQTTARPPAPLQSTPAPSTSGLGAPSPRNMPVFDNTEITNVTAQLGTTAFLPCRVRNLGERAMDETRKKRKERGREGKKEEKKIEKKKEKEKKEKEKKEKKKKEKKKKEKEKKKRKRRRRKRRKTRRRGRRRIRNGINTSYKIYIFTGLSLP